MALCADCGVSLGKNDRLNCAWCDAPIHDSTEACPFFKDSPEELEELYWAVHQKLPRRNYDGIVCVACTFGDD